MNSANFELVVPARLMLRAVVKIEIDNLAVRGHGQRHIVSKICDRCFADPSRFTVLR
jgi:hypothetical protein